MRGNHKSNKSYIDHVARKDKFCGTIFICTRIQEKYGSSISHNFFLAVNLLQFFDQIIEMQKAHIVLFRLIRQIIQ